MIFFKALRVVFRFGTTISSLELPSISICLRAHFAVAFGASVRLDTMRGLWVPSSHLREVKVFLGTFFETHFLSVSVIAPQWRQTSRSAARIGAGTVGREETDLVRFV